jgi:hypothetical protein
MMTRSVSRAVESAAPRPRCCLILVNALSLETTMAESTSVQLLSRSCTTGWLDWVWGELWLMPDGIARLSLGWAGTRKAARRRKKHGGGASVEPGEVHSQTVSVEDLEQRIAADPKNRWIPCGDIRSARLRRGILNDRLQVELSTGANMKLLWLKSDPAFEVLSGRLGERLGLSLTLR